MKNSSCHKLVILVTFDVVDQNKRSQFRTSPPPPRKCVSMTLLLVRLRHFLIRNWALHNIRNKMTRGNCERMENYKCVFDLKTKETKKVLIQKNDFRNSARTNRKSSWWCFFQ